FSHSSSVFHNYQVKRPSEINIGRTDDNDIAYPTAYVSKRHATIRLDVNGAWTVQDRGNRDEGSVNGVFVNGERISKKNERGMIESPLKVGDTVDIMCARIIIGIDFISVNVDENRIRVVKSEKLKRVSSTDLMGFPNMPSHPQESAALFNRLPRRRTALEPSTIEIKAPPVSLNSNDIPMLLRMGGPMVMSGASVLAGHFTMMISSVLFPVLTQRYTEKQRKEYEIRRNSRYKAYLNAKSVEIQNELGMERSILCANYPELAKVLRYAETGDKLWERRKTDDDFLSLRLGSGKLPLMAPLSYPPRDFDMDEDPLLEEMYALAETRVYLEHVPVMNSFVEDFVCGVLGRRDIALSFVKGLVMQLAILHSYDEVKLVFLSSEDELDELEFVRYLPHIWNDQKDFRFLAVNAEEAYQIGEYLSNEIGEDLTKQRELKQILKNRPYYVVVALDKRVFDSMEVLKDVMQADQNCGVSVLAVFDDLPKECIKIFDLRSSGDHSVVYLKQIDKEDDAFQADRFEMSEAVQSMRTISNINLRVVSQAYSLPKSISFLEMYEVGRVENLNVLKRWNDSNSVKSLSAPVGVDTSGSLFTLDLHEKFQGPHGLVAGMTGSGKSEFIISYILSMAVNFHPDDVAFVLIDYKGGGLAGAFEDESRGIHLPHVVGTITNLDGPSIQRSLMSIQSELKRRQEIFNKAKSLYNEGTMDIYVYQKLYHAQKEYKKAHPEEVIKEDEELQPLPHLFIISDEFAELKKQESEFMDQLISAARIGRSLGVHLILATQKPSGVVDDQIWSNTKFRVCLRVQDRGDSFEMLKRPEAAELRDTGRFYLQVGYNEYFALGQSAYCGADYIPQDEVVVQKDDEIQVVDSVGRNILTRRPDSEQNEDDSKKIKQIMAIVNHISDVAWKEHIEPRPLWTEALRKRLDLDDLIEEYRIARGHEVEAIIGQVDDPAHQKQFPLIMNLQQSRNLLIAGESGSGKTTMLQTILYYVATHYSPEDVNFYILDFSSRNLGIFKGTPHCGAFLTDEHEDKIDSLFALIREIIDERRKLFAEAEVSSFEAYREEVAPLPLILFVIDNVSQFEELENGYQCNNTLGELMRGGVGYGIKTIFTISQINDCPLRLRREAGNKIALRARDR
ncbi:MAG: type VII secretion protein EssC, partial [Oscillospiraceae bacterium]|nr:type VII secretion protein EssC [Oscillospiraceae bacterium]